ncbi:MAG: DNA adenine methylase [Halobacteria archaeon]
MEINSPFRYAGGKFYARKLIMRYIPPHSCYIEPFAGGASIFFAKPKVEYNWLNDLDEELMNCFIHIRDYPEKMIERLKHEKASKERHYYYKNVYKPQTDLDRAVRWFYLNRTSYSGIMNMQNCFWGYGDKYSMRPENWPRNIRRASKKLQGVKLTAWDFEPVIDQAPDGAFLFVDPPYFNADQDKFYNPTFTREDHLRLCRVLKKHSKRLKFLLTYDNTPEVKKLYYWAKEIHEQEWYYTINRTDDQKNGSKRKGKRYKGQEIFILNYDSPQQQPSLFEQNLAIHEFIK